MATELKFYHILGRNYDKSLAKILSAQFARNKKTFVITDDTQKFDNFLWEYDANSFLPHALWNHEKAHDIPILIANEWQEIAENSDSLLILNGMKCPENIINFSLIIIAFRDEEDEHKNYARELWKQFQNNPDFHLSYHQQDAAGKWIVK